METSNPLCILGYLWPVDTQSFIALSYVKQPITQEYTIIRSLQYHGFDSNTDRVLNVPLFNVSTPGRIPSKPHTQYEQTKGSPLKCPSNLPLKPRQLITALAEPGILNGNGRTFIHSGNHAVLWFGPVMHHVTVIPLKGPAHFRSPF